MILADKIIEQRKKLGLSQEELAGMMDVSRQSVSKWESAQSTPDINKILALSKIFDVSTDYLLKDEIEEEGEYIPGEGETPIFGEAKTVRKVSLQDVNDYLKIMVKSARNYAFATLFCIISAIPLILFATMGEEGILFSDEDLGGVIGLAIMLVLVAVAVAIYVFYGRKMSVYEYLDKEPIETEYGVSGVVKDRRQKYSDIHTRDLVLGIVLCIISTIPLITAAVVSEKVGSDFVASIGVCVMLLFIAAGVFFIVRTSMRWSAFEKLLEEGDYTREKKSKVNKSVAFSVFYWCMVAAVFLGYSLWTRNWGYSWIIWVVAGVLYAGISGLMSYFFSREGQ